MSTTINMKTLVDAHAALTLVQSVIEAQPTGVFSPDLWNTVMRARVALGCDLQMLNPVEVKGAPHEQA